MTAWDMPRTVDAVDAAFGDVTGLLPTWEEILAQFKTHNGTKWNEFQRDWFFSGLQNPRYKVRAGVDFETALAHLSAIQHSYLPKHEHKAAAVAWLASLWFVSVRCGKKKYR